MNEKKSSEFQRFDLVQHKRTQGFYILEKFLKVRVRGHWVAGVMYSEIDDREQSYVRPLEDFIECFDLARPYHGKYD
jgi:hypothetical protein